MAKSNTTDPVKKIFGKTAEEMFVKTNGTHSAVQNNEEFCGSSGPEEMRHIQELVDKLSDKELVTLVKNAGFPKLIGDWEKPSEVRSICEGVIDEIKRENFYREYRKIIESK